MLHLIESVQMKFTWLGYSRIIPGMLSLTINLLNKYIFDFIYNTRILLKIIATGLGD